MAVLQLPEEHRTIRERAAIADYLAKISIDYEVWEPSQPLSAEASHEYILHAYSADIEKLKARGGYVTADVINVNPKTPGLDVMLAKFCREHIHSEDEVRFVVQGRGIFHINPKTSPVVGIEVERREVDVGEHRPRAQPRDRAGSGEEGERAGHHLVAGAHAERHQRDHQRIGSRRDPDGVGQPGAGRQLCLERLDLGAEHVLSAPQHS